MASVEQSALMEKYSDASSLSQSASQNSLMDTGPAQGHLQDMQGSEVGPAQSHLHDMRGPEVVYNIDEETRMGPEPSNDVTSSSLSTEATVKERGPGKRPHSKPQSKEEASASNSGTGGAPFSALSFIASQYAESDNSSPRSLDSPAGVTEDGSATAVPEPTGNSSDGFDTSSLMAAPKTVPPEQASSIQVGGKKESSEKMEAGGDAPVAPIQPVVISVKEPEMVTEGSKDGDVKIDTGLDKETDGNKEGADVEIDKAEVKDADESMKPVEREAVEKAETEVKPEVTVTPAESVAEGDHKNVSETVSGDVQENVFQIVEKEIKQELVEASAASDDKRVPASQPELTEASAEPMEIDDDEGKECPVQEKIVTEETDVDSKKKETVSFLEPARDSSAQPKQAPDVESVLSTDGKFLDANSIMSEDSKLDSQVVQDMDSAMCEDSAQAADMDSMIDTSSRLVSNLDSIMSEDSKMASNMDSVMSDDSKMVGNAGFAMSEDSRLLSNIDSVLSSGPEESEEATFSVKGPSKVIPFGENANSSIPFMGMEIENSNISFIDESSQSNSMAEKPPRPKKPRRSSISDIQDSKLENEDGLQPFPADRVFEYQWPQDGGEWYLLQEQISEYLGVLSFKRKYPDLNRRTCDKLEKEFLREKGVVTETQSDLGLTAIRSEEVYDLMMRDYPDKYHEYATLLHEREKQKISDKHKEYEAAAQPKLEKSKMADYMKKAAKSAAEYNRHLLRERKEERLAFFDLQTFMIQYPEQRYKKLAPEATKPSPYPVALIPGQFQDHYCSYTSDELRYFPLNTALYDPPKKMSNTLAKPAGSGESSDSSSEDKSGSSSDSSGSSSSDSETLAGAASAAASASKSTGTDTNQQTAVTPTPAEASGTPGRKSGKKGVAKTPAKTPKRPIGRPLKGKRKLDGSLDRKDGNAVGASAAGSGGAVPTAAQSVSPAPRKEKGEEEDEDKDKCRICENAVLFLRNKKVETKMIKCAECGKIAHPTCLELTDKMLQVVTTYPWQCMDCKTCVECMDPNDEDKMLFCDRCDRGYHTFCVGLRCLPPSGRRWECRSCKGAAGTAKSRRGRPLKPT